MMIEGSGSGRPKNMWIRIRIRINNTAHYRYEVNPVSVVSSSLCHTIEFETLNQFLSIAKNQKTAR
jgi:hypothetical protein